MNSKNRTLPPPRNYSCLVAFPPPFYKSEQLLAHPILSQRLLSDTITVSVLSEHRKFTPCPPIVTQIPPMRALKTRRLRASLFLLMSLPQMHPVRLLHCIVLGQIDQQTYLRRPKPKRHSIRRGLRTPGGGGLDCLDVFIHSCSCDVEPPYECSARTQSTSLIRRRLFQQTSPAPFTRLHGVQAMPKYVADLLGFQPL